MDCKHIDSRLMSIYLHEVIWLCTAIKENSEYIFENAPLPEKGHYIKIAPDIHSRIFSILSSSANLKKLIWTNQNQSKSESNKAYKLRLHRSKYLKELLSDLHISEIKYTKVRNTIEHFDEYLDNENIKLSQRIPFNKAIAYNMVLSDLNLSEWNLKLPSKGIHPFRIYVSNERKFYNMKWSVDIGKIYNETNLIENKLKSLFPKLETGGLLIFLK